MTQKFQLQCSECSTTVIVEPRHAGSSIECVGCNQPVDIPKLRELKQLEPIDESLTSPNRKEWGQLSGALFVFGILLLVIAVGSCGYLTWLSNRYRPHTEKPEIRDNYPMESISLTDAWSLWGSLRENPDVTQRSHDPIYVRAREAMSRFEFWSKIFYGIATVGILSMISALFTRPAAHS